MGYHRLLLLLALFALHTGCARTLTPSTGYRHTLGAEHPLVGRVYAREQGKLVRAGQLLHAIDTADVLLLGEIHDNADHHQIEADLLSRWLRSHPQGKVGFEMLNEAQAGALSPLPPDADALSQRVHWQDSGWPDFALYRPVFEVLLRARAPIVAAHPSREHVRASMHALSAEQTQALKLSEPLAPAAREALAQEIKDSHCGHAPEAMVEPMMRAQSYKDAFMARALAEAKVPVALVAGSGHVREDRGVPLFLSRQGIPSVVSVRLVSVDDDHLEPRDYDTDVYDFVLFTPRTSDESACSRFEEQLKRMRQASSTVTP